MLCKTAGGIFFLTLLFKAGLFVFPPFGTYVIWKYLKSPWILTGNMLGSQQCKGTRMQYGVKGRHTVHGTLPEARQMRFRYRGKLGRTATNPNRSRIQTQELGVRVALPSLPSRHQHVAVTASEVFLEFSFRSQAPRSWWAGPLNLTRTNTERWRPDSCFSVRGHEIPLHSRGKRGFAHDFLGRGNHLWTETSTSIYYSALSHLSGNVFINV